MNGPIRRLASLIFIAFVVMIGGLVWNQVIIGADYRDDTRNARLITFWATRERGTIITRDGTVVAESFPDPDNPHGFRRRYPEGAAYAHVVGYATALFGSSAIESRFSSDLIGNRDITISGVIDALLGEDPRSKGLRLTIEHDLQIAAIEALAGQVGAIVALDPRTGEILALVSSPSFDPNTLAGHTAALAGQALDNDPAQPLLNRTISWTYPPGSTFKVLTTAAALESGTVSVATAYNDQVELNLPGSTAVIRNFDNGVCVSGTEVSLTEAFIWSCNTVFGQIALDVGGTALLASGENAGFNEPISFDLRVVPSVISSDPNFASNLPAVAQTALGQRDVRVTPLQMALVAAAVANKGEIMEPHLIAEVFSASAKTLRRTQPTRWKIAMTHSTAQSLTHLMEQVVTAGTGTGAAVPGIRIAGKTGTAEVPDAPPHLWFIGFGPVDPEDSERQIAIAVLIESRSDVGDTATGGQVAAPIAGAIIKFYLGK